MFNLRINRKSKITMIPVNTPVIPPEAKTFVNDCLDTGWISSAGSYLQRFEEDFAKYVNRKHAIAVSNGTVSLHVALAALGIGPGDEVIVPAFTIISCLNAILYTGAIPVIVDVEPDIYTLDPNQLEKAFSPKTKAIMPVHIYGHPADMDPIIEFAKKHNLFIIEDAAETHGALYKGKNCGSFGEISSFSFYANKLITTGEGGIVVTDDDILAEKSRDLRNLCHLPGQRFHHKTLGFNYRMTNVQAAIGCAQLLHAEEFFNRKRKMGKLYDEGLAEIPGIEITKIRDWATSSYWMYPLRVTEKSGMTCKEFQKKLKEKGVDTRDFFWPLSNQPMLKDFDVRVLPCPVSEKIAIEGCYLPSGLALTESEIKKVIETVKSIM